ncbi:hypothetical protein YC2023_088693 [Brassica napus]
MASKITFFLLFALVIACATMVSVPTAEATYCLDSKDCPDVRCKIGEIERCRQNLCTCVPQFMVSHAG